MEVLRLQNLQKSFGSVRALKSASFTLNEGEVVALLGDNGAGKSTLIKAISGVFPVDRGDIYVRGQKVSIRSTRDAMDLGIETIHQDTSLAPDLSIARNLFLGREPVNLKWLGVFAPLDLAKLRDAAAALLKRVGISKKLDADALVSTLSGGERQSIAISRAMQFAAKVIILDEPTNNLGVEETHGVLRFVKEVRGRPFGAFDHPQHPSRLSGRRPHYRHAPRRDRRRADGRRYRSVDGGKHHYRRRYVGPAQGDESEVKELAVTW